MKLLYHSLYIAIFHSWHIFAHANDLHFKNLSFDDIPYENSEFLKHSNGFIYGAYHYLLAIPGWTIEGGANLHISINNFAGEDKNFMCLINKNYIGMGEDWSGNKGDDYFLMLTYSIPISSIDPQDISPYCLKQTGLIPDNALYFSGVNPLYDPLRGEFSDDGFRVVEVQ